MGRPLAFNSISISISISSPDFHYVQWISLNLSPEINGTLWHHNAKWDDASQRYTSAFFYTLSPKLMNIHIFSRWADRWAVLDYYCCWRCDHVTKHGYRLKIKGHVLKVAVCWFGNISGNMWDIFIMEVLNETEDEACWTYLQAYHIYHLQQLTEWRIYLPNWKSKQTLNSWNSHSVLYIIIIRLLTLDRLWYVTCVYICSQLYF